MFDIRLKGARGWHSGSQVKRKAPYGLRSHFVIWCAIVSGSVCLQRAEADELPLPQVTVAHPIAQSVPRWDEYTGRFEPLQEVEVRPRVSGAVDTVNFVDGQMVKQGDLLFVID